MAGRVFAPGTQARAILIQNGASVGLYWLPKMLRLGFNLPAWIPNQAKLLQWVSGVLP